jgi:AraC family transcriptional regulator
MTTPYNITAEKRLPAAELLLVEVDSDVSMDMSLRLEGHYHLDLSLTPRPPRTEICFTERWRAHRFETAGTLFMVPPEEEFRIRSEPCRLGLVVCNLATDVLTELFEGDFEWTDQRLAASLDVVNGDISRLLLGIGEEVRRPSFGSEIMVEAMVMQLAVLLSRQFRNSPEHPPRGGLAQWQLRILDELLAGSDRIITLSELATACRLSTRHLSRAFLASRGQSIGSYVADHRLEKAKRLLARGERVQDVSQGLGFSSPSNFCSAFRRSTGCSPGQFQRRAH